MRSRFGQGQCLSRYVMILGLVFVIFSVAPAVIVAEGEGTPPAEQVPDPLPTDVPPPPTEIPPPPTEVPPPPTQAPLPTDVPPPPTEVPTPVPVPTDVPTEIPPTAVPTTAPLPTSEPVSTPEPEPTATSEPTPSPTSIRLPQATCVQEGAIVPVSPGQVVEYRCDFVNGPIKPYLTYVEEGWEISRTGLQDTWMSQLDADLAASPEESGTLRLYIRATAEADPGTAEIRVDFRSGDFAEDAPKVSVILMQSLLEPTPTPSPTPTPEPAIAFAPDVQCSPGNSIGSGQDIWAMQDCTATWKTENVTSVELNASTHNAAWRVVAALPADATASRMELGSGTLLLTDSKPDDKGFYSSQFSIGTKVTACTTDNTVQVALQLNAVSHKPVPKDEAGEPLVDIAASPKVNESWSGDVAVTSATQSEFNVSLVSASFTPIDISSGSSSSTGTFVIDYRVPAGCEWQLTLSLPDLVNGSQTIPISSLDFERVQGITAAMGSSGTGTLVISPEDSATATSGQIVVTGTLELDGFIANGEYRTTVTASGELLP